MPPVQDDTKEKLKELRDQNITYREICERVGIPETYQSIVWKAIEGRGIATRNENLIRKGLGLEPIEEPEPDRLRLAFAKGGVRVLLEYGDVPAEVPRILALAPGKATGFAVLTASWTTPVVVAGYLMATYTGGERHADVDVAQFARRLTRLIARHRPVTVVCERFATNERANNPAYGLGATIQALGSTIQALEGSLGLPIVWQPASMKEFFLPDAKVYLGNSGKGNPKKEHTLDAIAHGLAYLERRIRKEKGMSLYYRHKKSPEFVITQEAMPKEFAQLEDDTLQEMIEDEFSRSGQGGSLPRMEKIHRYIKRKGLYEIGGFWVLRRSEWDRIETEDA